MFDTSLVAFAYGFLGIAAVAVTLAVAVIVVAVRDLRGSTATPALAAVAGPSERAFTRAA